VYIQVTLKYGCNPHQTPAAIYNIVGTSLPFSIVNGTPGYINLLDACNAYQLVRELRTALGLPAATSFKHVSPAGAGLAVPLGPAEAMAYEIEDAASLSPLAVVRAYTRKHVDTYFVCIRAHKAYLRARNADPMSSFGDFVAVSDIVDVATANILKKEVRSMCGVLRSSVLTAVLGIRRYHRSGLRVGSPGDLGC
jgi:phosphoribosylaminoimidazolecarboxamide formyltransferase/IMP cyclohydrolase